MVALLLWATQHSGLYRSYAQEVLPPPSCPQSLLRLDLQRCAPLLEPEVLALVRELQQQVQQELQALQPLLPSLGLGGCSSEQLWWAFDLGERRSRRRLAAPRLAHVCCSSCARAAASRPRGGPASLPPAPASSGRASASPPRPRPTPTRAVRTRCFSAFLPGRSQLAIYAPLLDLANHSAEPNSAFQLDHASSTMGLAAAKYSGLAPGQEVLISYGSTLSNAQLLASYGLVVADNSSDVLQAGELRWAGPVWQQQLMRWVGAPAACCSRRLRCSVPSHRCPVLRGSRRRPAQRRAAGRCRRAAEAVAEPLPSPEARQMVYVALAFLASLPTKGGRARRDCAGLACCAPAAPPAVAGGSKCCPMRAAAADGIVRPRADGAAEVAGSSSAAAAMAAMAQELQAVAAGLQQAIDGASAHAGGAAEAPVEAEAWQVRGVPGYLLQQMLRYRREKLKLVGLCVALLEAARKQQ
jgi:hypothetical protein